MLSLLLKTQELFADEAARAIIENLQPHGVVVVMESHHLDMAIYVVEKTGGTAITRCVECFEKQLKNPQGVFSLIDVNRA